MRTYDSPKIQFFTLKTQDIITNSSDNVGGALDEWESQAKNE